MLRKIFIMLALMALLLPNGHLLSQEGPEQPVLFKLGLKFKLNKTDYEVGDVAELRFSVKNEHHRNVSLRGLDFEERSLSLFITYTDAGGTKHPEFRYTRNLCEYDRAKSEFARDHSEAIKDSNLSSRKTLEPEESAELNDPIKIPVLREGNYEIRGEFKGYGLENLPVPSISLLAKAKGKTKEMVAVLRIQDDPEKDETKNLILQLHPEKNLAACLNFANLILDKKYNGLAFHRVIKDKILQGGSPNGKASGDMNYLIRTNKDLTGDFHKGAVAMAARDFGRPFNCQFFICVDQLPELPDQPAPFATIIKGFEQAEALSRVETDSDQKPEKDITIKRATLEPRDLAEAGIEPPKEEDTGIQSDFYLDIKPNKTELTLGEDLNLRLRVINRSNREQKAKNFLFDADSVSFKVRYLKEMPKEEEKKEDDKKKEGDNKDDKKEEKKDPWEDATEFTVSRNNVVRSDKDSVDNMKFATYKLAPGRMMSFELNLPMLMPGFFRIEALYRSGAGNSTLVKSQEKPVIEVKKDGEKDKLVARFKIMQGGESSEVLVRLHPEAAFNTALHFAMHAKAGGYNNTSFFQIDEKGKAMIGGDPEKEGDNKPDGSGNPGWRINSDHRERAYADAKLEHKKGTLSLHRPDATRANSGSCVLYWAMGPNTELDSGGKQLTIFGRVIEGLDKLEKLLDSEVREDTQAYKDEEKKIEKAVAASGEEKAARLEKLHKTALIPIKEILIDSVTLETWKNEKD